MKITLTYDIEIKKSDIESMKDINKNIESFILNHPDVLGCIGNKITMHYPYY